MHRPGFMRELLADFREFTHDGRLKGLLYFSWDDREYGVYRCGGLTYSGQLALTQSLVD